MSTHKKTKNVKKQNVARKIGVRAHVSDALPSTLHPSLQKAWSLIQKNDYAGAANLLASAGRDVQVRNTLGLCLMRLGRVDDAVDVFRSFVLMPGSLIERPEVSNACKRNFATALLMKGFPSGSLSVLAETRDPNHLMAVQLFSAIKQWEKTLPWFRRLDWKLNGIEPPNCHVPLEFELGEFDFLVQVKSPVKPANQQKSSLKTAA